MNSFIFNRSNFDRYYSCIYSDVKNFPTESSPNLGSLFIFTFAVFEILYIPILVIFSQPYYRGKSCYKFMHAITCIDLLTMPINGGLTGYFFIYGYSYCDYPLTNLFAGAFANIFWMGQSLLTVILAFNRCLSMNCPYWENKLFGKDKPHLWIFGTVIYMIAVFFGTESAFFNSNLGAWFFNPFLGHNHYNYRNYIHTIHNSSIPILLGIFYIGFAFSLIRKKLNNSRTPEVTTVVKSEVVIFLQVLYISLANFFCALTYDLAQIFPLPIYLIKASSYMWLIVHGFPSVLYLTTNHKVRRDFVRIFCERKSLQTESSQSISLNFAGVSKYDSFL